MYIVHNQFTKSQLLTKNQELSTHTLSAEAATKLYIYVFYCNNTETYSLRRKAGSVALSTRLSTISVSLATLQPVGMLGAGSITVEAQMFVLSIGVALTILVAT